MLTPAPAARSFSEFLFGRTPAAGDDTTHQHSQVDPLDQVSYFDTIMRTHTRRTTARRRLIRG